MAKPPVSIDATVRAKVGKRSVDRLVEAVVDAFSPASESLGLLGDAVRLARVEIATTITRRAQAIALENGLTLKAPPLKFLVPFYEKASLEDESSGDLIEMWANLLVAAGSEFDANQLRYSAILSEMSGEQARLLNQIMTNYGTELGDDIDELELFYSLVQSRFVAEAKRDLKTKDADEFLRGVQGKLCVGGVSVVMIMFEAKDEVRDLYDWGDDPVYADSKSVTFEVLRSHGLIEHVSTEFFPTDHFDLSVIYYFATELGYDFWKTCRGRVVEN